MDYRNILSEVKVTSLRVYLFLLTSICYLNKVSWNVSVSRSGLKSRPAGIFFTKKVKEEKKLFFSEKSKKGLMVVASLVKMLQSV